MYFERESPLERGNFWWRCRFEIVKDEGIPVIRPVLDSTVDFYSPLKDGSRPKRQIQYPDDKSQLWAPHAHLARVNTEDEILEFVNHWGLLGLWKMKRYAKADFMPERDTIKPMFDYEHSKWYLWNFPDGVKPAFPTEVCHQEPLSEFMAAADNYKEWLRNLTYSREEGMNSAYSIPGCSPNIIFDASNNRWELLWSYENLLAAIYLSTAIGCAGGEYGFKSCKHKKCGKPFLAKHEGDQFCSTRCQNNYFSGANKRAKRQLQREKGV